MLQDDEEFGNDASCTFIWVQLTDASYKNSPDNTSEEAHDIRIDSAAWQCKYQQLEVHHN